MISLQVYLYIYLQLTEVGHLQSTPFGSYALSPTMLPLLEKFLEFLLFNSVQYRRHIFWMSSVS